MFLSLLLTVTIVVGVVVICYMFFSGLVYAIWCIGWIKSMTLYTINCNMNIYPMLFVAVFFRSYSFLVEFDKLSSQRRHSAIITSSGLRFISRHSVGIFEELYHSSNVVYDFGLLQQWR